MSGWPSAPLGELFEIARGGSPRPISDYLTDDPGGVNWISISDATEGSKYITQTKRRIRAEGVSKSRMVHTGDFLLTNSMSFGHPYIVKTSGCIHDGWLVLRPKQDIDADFMYHLLGSNETYAKFERLAAGVTVKNLNIDLVRQVEVPLPPLGEQRRIAAILDHADALRRKRREALNRLDDLERSIFNELKCNWEKTAVSSPLGGVVEEFRYGTSEKSNGNGYPTLRIPNVIRGGINLYDLKFVPVSSKDADRLRLQLDDLLFVRTNGNPDYVGRCAAVTSALEAASEYSISDFIFASYLIRARLRDKTVNAIYLQSYLNSQRGRKALLERAKTSAGQYNINIEGLSSVPVLLPPIEAQHDFAKKIVEIAESRALYNSHLQSLDSLFASLQHRAFRGEL